MNTLLEVEVPPPLWIEREIEDGGQRIKSSPIAWLATVVNGLVYWVVLENTGETSCSHAR